MTEPAFSVVVPAYNSAGTVTETIASILGQTLTDFELTVVDDGSTDETPALLDDIAATDARIRVIHRENGGTSAARNTGIEASSAPLVSFLDDDDLWLPTYLEAVAAMMEAHPGAGFAHVDAWIFDQTLQRIRRTTSFEHYDPIPEYLAPGPLLERLVEINYVMSSVTCRASVLSDIGGFDTKLRGTDDWDMWLRIAAAGFGATHPAEPQLVQRDRSDSQGKDEALMIRNAVAVLGKLIADPGLGERERAIATKRAASQRRKLEQVERNSPVHRLRVARRSAIALRAKRAPAGEWLAEPPATVASAMPSLVASYGRPASSDS